MGCRSGIGCTTFVYPTGRLKPWKEFGNAVAGADLDDWDKILERLGAAGKGAFRRGVEDLTKLLESYQPKKPTYKGPHLTDAEYDLLLERQGGACAICGEKPSIRLVVDHDHETGAVRGLLCNPCNLALGLFKDDSSRLGSAVTYVQKTRGNSP